MHDIFYHISFKSVCKMYRDRKVCLNENLRKKRKDARISIVQSFCFFFVFGLLSHIKRGKKKKAEEFSSGDQSNCRFLFS